MIRVSSTWTCRLPGRRSASPLRPLRPLRPLALDAENTTISDERPVVQGPRRVDAATARSARQADPRRQVADLPGDDVRSGGRVEVRAIETARRPAPRVGTSHVVVVGGAQLERGGGPAPGGDRSRVGARRPARRPAEGTPPQCAIRRAESWRPPRDPVEITAGDRRAVTGDRGRPAADRRQRPVDDRHDHRRVGVPAAAALAGRVTHTSASRTTLSGAASQRTETVRHLGSSLTEMVYVSDEPTVGLHSTHDRR